MFILKCSHVVRIGLSLSNYIGPFESIAEAHEWFNKHIKDNPDYMDLRCNVEPLIK